MKTTLRFSSLLSLLLALLLCGGAVAEGLPADVMATVNGTPITRASYESYLADVTDFYLYSGYDVTDPTTASYLRYMSLSTLVQMTLMDQKIAEMGLTLTAEERAAAEAQGRNQWVTDVSNTLGYFGITAASTEAERAAAMVQALAELEALGYTEELYVTSAVNDALYIKLENEIMSGATVTDLQVHNRWSQLVEADRARYANDAAAYESTMQMNVFALMSGMTEYYTDVWYIPEGYRIIAHILLPVDVTLLESWGDLEATWEEQQNLLEEGGVITDEVVTAEEVENARLAALLTVQPQTDEIASRLAGGEAFTDLIPLYTADDTMDEPEEIAYGWEIHMDSIYLPIGYRDATFSLMNPGDVSEPFLSEDGVYILFYVGDLPGGPVELTEERYAMLYNDLLMEAQSERLVQTMQGWINEADIVYNMEAQSFMIY